MGQADAAYQAARQAVSKTANIRQAVEEALARHYHASTTLSTEQVTKLAHDTSQEMQMAVQERQQLKTRLQDQQAETERLRAELQKFQAAQSSELQGMQQQQLLQQE